MLYEVITFIEKIEEHTHQVGHCYRCKNIVEPYISKQWFVRSEVARGSIDKTNAGLTQFFPAHWINSYNAWMNDLRDCRITSYNVCYTKLLRSAGKTRRFRYGLRKLPETDQRPAVSIRNYFGYRSDRKR